MIEIGKHLLFDGHSYQLEFSGEETKTGRRYVAGLPEQLTPHIGRHLNDYRRALQIFAEVPSASDSFWLDRYGRAMRSGAIRQEINERSKAAFGKSIWPICSVTALLPN